MFMCVYLFIFVCLGKCKRMYWNVYLTWFVWWSQWIWIPPGRSVGDRSQNSVPLVPSQEAAAAVCFSNTTRSHGDRPFDTAGVSVPGFCVCFFNTAITKQTPQSLCELRLQSYTVFGNVPLNSCGLFDRVLELHQGWSPEFLNFTGIGCQSLLTSPGLVGRFSSQTK